LNLRTKWNNNKKFIATEFTRCKQLLTAQQLALETLTNICCVADDPDGEWANVNEEIEEIIDNEVDNITTTTNTTNEEKLSDELIQLLTSSAVLQKVLLKCNELQPTIVQFERDNAHITSSYHFVQSFRILRLRAFSALSNLVLVLPSQALDGEQSLWNALIASNTSFVNDEEFLEITTAIEWSLLQKCPTLLVTKEQSEPFIFIMRSNSEEVRTNTVGILNILAQRLNPPTEETLTILGSIFLEKLADTSLLVVCEALNAIFDVFANDNFNASVFPKLDMINKLCAFTPVFTSRLKSEKKRMNKELKERLDDAKLNLSRFIKYKVQQK